MGIRQQASIVPSTAGTPALFAADEKWILAANTVYYFPLPQAIAGAGGLLACQLTCYDATAVITAYIEDSLHATAPLTTDSIEWVKEDPPSSYVGVVGVGWASTAASVSSVGTGAGSAIWHMELGSVFARLRVSVGAAGGAVRVASSSKGP